MAELSVVHLCTADRLGGAARSAYKVHSGLRARGVRSRMLVGTRVTNDPDVAPVAGGPRRWLDRMAVAATDRLSWQYLYVPSSNRLPRHPWVSQADVIQLYNTHGGYFSHRVLPRLARDRPIVWRLSDMWAATGHCAYSGACEKWRSGCRGCPDLATYPAIRRDTAAALFRKKDRIYREARPHVVAPSTWIAQIARESPLLGRFELSVIPNGVDAGVFRPVPRAVARDLLGLPGDRPVVLFGAHILDDNPRKGVEHVPEIVRRLSEQHGLEFTLALLGEGRAAWADALPVPVVRLGFLADDLSLAVAYAAADLYIHPATHENLPNTILEAASCGVPIVAFDCGGVSDAVVDGAVGFLADAADVEGFAEAAARLLRDRELRERFGRAAREAVLERFTLDRQTGDFLDLYRRLLAEAPGRDRS